MARSVLAEERNARKMLNQPPRVMRRKQMFRENLKTPLHRLLPVPLSPVFCSGMDTLLGTLLFCNALSLTVSLKVQQLLNHILAEGGRRGEGVAEVGELLVVVRCNVSIQAYFLCAINVTARLVEIVSVALDSSLCFIATQLLLGIQLDHPRAVTATFTWR